jgi:amino acid transporter
VYAAMARDGYLPRAFAGREGKPPLWSVLMQGTIAVSVAMTTSFIKAIGTIGSILTLMAALTALGVFKLQLDPAQEEKPGIPALIAATVFVGLAGWMLYFSFTSPILNSAELPLLGKVSLPLIWLGFISLVSVTYAIWVAIKRRRGPA